MAEKKDREEVKQQFEELIQSMEKEKKQDSAPLFGFLSGSPSPAAPSSSASPQASAPVSPAVEKSLEEMQKKMKELEQEVLKEKEKSLSATLRFQERENARLEMENMFKALREQMRHEKMEQEMDNERAKSRDRVELLEKRLDEMNALLLGLVREQKNPAAGFSPDMVEKLMARQNELVSLVNKKDEEISRMQASFNETFKSATEFGDAKWKDEKKILTEEKEALQNTAKALYEEKDIQKRQIELMKASFSDMASRYDALVGERKKYLGELEEKDAKLARYRFQELSVEIEKLKAAASEILETPQVPSESTVRLFRKLMLEKEKELLYLREKLQDIQTRGNPST